MDKYYLLKCKEDWHDEFDLEGFVVLNEEQYKTFLSKEEAFKNNFEGCEVYFGSNESQEYKTIKDVLDAISIEEINKEDYNTLVRLNLTNMGIMCAYEAIMDFKPLVENKDDDIPLRFRNKK